MGCQSASCLRLAPVSGWRVHFRIKGWLNPKVRIAYLLENGFLLTRSDHAQEADFFPLKR